jgi:hypothetical protein
MLDVKEEEQEREFVMVWNEDRAVSFSTRSAKAKLTSSHSQFTQSRPP